MLPWTTEPSLQTSLREVLHLEDESWTSKPAVETVL